MASHRKRQHASAAWRHDVAKKKWREKYQPAGINNGNGASGDMGNAQYRNMKSVRRGSGI